MSRFFEYLQLGALACWAVLGLSRAILFRARGLRVIVIDRQRTLWQMLVDALAVTCLLTWAYEVVAHAWPFPAYAGPAILGHVLLNSIVIKSVGVVLLSASVLLYAVALYYLGESWRLGIDRNAPGPLVTDGIYRWTRHPIYLAFDLLFTGTFLVSGRLVFLLLALVWMPVMHLIMLREERFLSELYGDAYRDYCTRVGRYFPGHRSARKPDAG